MGVVGMLFACIVTARAEYTVVTAHENKDVRVYTVSDDGNDWKFQRIFKARKADGGQTPISVATGINCAKILGIESIPATLLIIR